MKSLLLLLVLCGCSQSQLACHAQADLNFQKRVKNCKALPFPERTSCHALAEHDYDGEDERCLR